MGYRHPGPSALSLTEARSVDDNEQMACWAHSLSAGTREDKERSNLGEIYERSLHHERRYRGEGNGSE